MKKLVLIMIAALMLPVLAACAQTGIAAEPQYTEAVAGGPAPLSPEDIEGMWSWMDMEAALIVVNGEVIDAPKPFTDMSVNGALMLPLIPIAEALGYTVVDNGNEVVIAPGTMVTEGVNSYFRGREAPMELASAPVMRDGVMYVPWEFFHVVLNAGGMVENGNIYIDTIVEE